MPGRKKCRSTAVASASPWWRPSRAARDQRKEHQVGEKKGERMYGLIGKMTAAPGQRDALSAVLLEAIEGMPGCLSYIVAKDANDQNALWITEVWDSKESH